MDSWLVIGSGPRQSVLMDYNDIHKHGGQRWLSLLQLGGSLAITLPAATDRYRQSVLSSIIYLHRTTCVHLHTAKGREYATYCVCKLQTCFLFYS